MRSKRKEKVLIRRKRSEKRRRETISKRKDRNMRCMSRKKQVKSLDQSTESICFIFEFLVRSRICR